MMMRYLSYGVYIFLQCTWGILQTLTGLVYFLLSLKYPHEFYHGCIKTKRPDIGGVSLGLFIFVSDRETGGFSDRTAVHEFGHTIQSLILGPLYLPTVGVISGLWCLIYGHYMKKGKISRSYNWLFTERNANFFGELILKAPSTRGIL